ncbi:hypothetical protein AMIS_69420 [Actinoplanes missouriensis 431]|uniref:Uncharacterized protein n=1 Tax=Actinoplanes missouriensis (strain ATCC 14538 / DSM 43046 / CBS 188.64 / JCM 3121 / NBRC 102363 / NCIMB 12654 / NRRL B-3342 / UNCC 431) TaxID=512565 RepID=I0HGM5_ACTM4|nr:hypothetical protein [Actinoplanes missouriensis]BAL92162.1 hypothetical protein AMIS_69420 [Actinoplanes missouriensis 431]
MAQQSWWRRFRTWLAGPDTGPDRSALPEVRHRPSTPGDAVPVLSKGDVYEFQVIADLEWISSVMDHSELVRQSVEYTPAAHDELRRRVWRIGRQFDPDAADAAEERMRAEAAEWCYDTDRGQIRCVAEIRVRPDERVREHLVPYALRRIDLNQETEIGNRRAEMVENLVTRWRKVLTELGVSPITVAAAQLTDRHFAEILDLLAAKRRQQGQDLVDVLGQAALDHQQLGMFEFAEMYASAAAAFVSQLGEEDKKFVRDIVEAELTAGRS